MRTIPPALAAHLAGQATTVCHAWRVTRRDGLVLGLTEHDAPLVFAGTDFEPASGYEASEMEGAVGLAVNTGEVAGAFSSEAITAKDLSEGRFDGATVEVFLVNWRVPEEHVHLATQEIGEARWDGQAFSAELRSLAGRLDAVRGRIYRSTCDADLGDGRCRVDLDDPAYWANGAVTIAADAAGCRASGLAGFAAGWFRFGLITFTSGANSGLSVEIDEHRLKDGEAVLSFWVPLANVPAAGDGFTIRAGCSKTFETCREKFGNHLNFQGFPHMPGADFAYGYVDSETVHDGRPLVE